MERIEQLSNENGLKHLTDGDEWMVAEDIPNIDFFFCQIWLRAFVNRMHHSCGSNYSKILAAFKGRDMSFYYGKQSCLDFTLNLVNKMDADPAYGEKINAEIVRHSDALEASAKKIPADLKPLSDEQLWLLLKDHLEVHSALYEWGWLSNATDMFYPEFTELLKRYLRTKAKGEDEVNTLFVALTTPSDRSEEAEQHERLLAIAIEIENDDFHKQLFLHQPAEVVEAEMRGKVKDMLLAYYGEYSPISALWVGEKAPVRHYITELSDYLKSGKSPAEELEGIENDLKVRALEKADLEEKIGVDGKHKRLFHVFGQFMLTKVYRRYRQLRAVYALRAVFKEIAKRKGITLDAARTMLPIEYEALLTGSFDLEKLQSRGEFVLYSEEGRDLLVTGEDAKLLAATAVVKVDSNISELHGQCACLGKAIGRVKIVLSPADLPKMQQGDILVAIATNPDVVPAMKKAGAIVTEQGGVTSHAAIVSRELGVPCVIGTKIATKVLKDGDLVEVDAVKGIVRKLEG